MDVQLYKYDVLEQELKRLPPFHRIAFAVSCCERLLSNYNAFYRRTGFGNPSILRTALDEIWQILQGKPVDVFRISQLTESCENIIPNLEEFPCSDHAIEAQECAVAVCNALDACLTPIPECVIKVATCITNTIDAFVPRTNESLRASLRGKSFKEQVATIANHPFAVREISKQTEDLQRLKEIDILDKDFLDWLRISSNNNGISLIGLS